MNALCIIQPQIFTIYIFMNLFHVVLLETHGDKWID